MRSAMSAGAFKQHIAAESQAENQGEGESCDC